MEKIRVYTVEEFNKFLCEDAIIMVEKEKDTDILSWDYDADVWASDAHGTIIDITEYIERKFSDGYKIYVK